MKEVIETSRRCLTDDPGRPASAAAKYHRMNAWNARQGVRVGRTKRQLDTEKPPLTVVCLRPLRSQVGRTFGRSLDVAQADFCACASCG